MEQPKPAIFMGDSKERLSAFPDPVKKVMGFALRQAQCGERHISAKPYGSDVIELIDDHDGDTYRAMYTVKLKGRVYVLHCFKKKSKSGISTPKIDANVIQLRLKQAKALHARLEKERKANGPDKVQRGK